MRPPGIVQPVAKKAHVLGLARRDVGGPGFNPASGPSRDRLPPAAQHDARIALGAPDRDGHVAPEVAVVEVTWRQRTDLEKTAGPAREFDDARHVIRAGMVLEIGLAPLGVAEDRRRAHATAEPQHGIDEMGARPQYRRTGSSVERPDLSD